MWVGLGMVTEAGGLSDADAMAMLRGYAFGRGVLLEDVTDQLTGHLTTADILQQR